MLNVSITPSSVYPFWKMLARTLFTQVMAKAIVGFFFFFLLGFAVVEENGECVVVVGLYGT